MESKGIPGVARGFVGEVGVEVDVAPFAESGMRKKKLKNKRR